MKKYESYKDSGIEWIGVIPSHWDAKRIKLYSPVKRGASPRPIDDPKYFDDNGEYAWVRIADVTASDRYLLNTTQRLSELGASLSVKRHEGDFFLSIAGSVGKPMITKIKCCIHDGFVYFPNLTINPEFLYYIFQTGLPYLGLGKLGTQLNLNTETVGNIFIPIPSEGEIEIITNYLDQKIAQIDDLIAKKERLIQLLEEERTAIINQAVTKGLDPTVPMKDSGIEWLGEIPAHWEVKKLKQIFNFNKGLTITKENLEDTGIPCVNYGEIHSKFGFELDLVQHQLKCVNENYLQSDIKAIIRKGDFVFADTSEDVDGAGNFTYLKSDDEIFAGYHTIVARTNYEIESRYFAYQFDSIPFRTQIRQSVKGIKVFSITQGILKNVQTWMPPLEDQILIVNFLDKKVHAIQNLTQTLKSEIKLMLEYKTALISEVVTGKVDVRDEKLN